MKDYFRHKIAGGFLVMAFLCVFVGYFAFITTRNMQKVFHATMSENVSGLKAAEELELALVNQKGLTAYYFLDEDSLWLKTLEYRKADFEHWFNKAADVALTPAEKGILKDISSLYRTYDSYRNRAIQFYQSGNTQEAKNILLKDMSESLEILYQKCEDFILVNESIIDVSGVSLQRKVMGMMTIIWVPTIVIIGLVGFMFFFLVRKILKSVESIAVTARNISLKDLSARVATADLEKEMESLAQSFNQMLERLERSFEYIKEFSASISHELKTPLAVIKGESEVALRKERRIEDYQRTLTVNVEEANRMIHIIEDLLFLTKLDYSPENIKKETFDFIPFFTEIQARAKTLVFHKQISFSAAIPEITVIVKGNKLHLSRLFFNIIQNAVKFTPSGGKIDIAVNLIKDALKVSISDTGFGISEKDLPRIFQRFFHREKSQSEGSDGIGLGLSITKSIARFHNGDIEVRSKLGQGSTFTVSLPILHT